MAAQPKIRYTSEEYLVLERQAEHKSEYIDGEIYAMTGASWSHATIAGNVFLSLQTQVRGHGCQAFGSDVRVRVTRSRYTYPDVGVVCGKPQLEDSHGDTLLNPKVIVEV